MISRVSFGRGSFGRKVNWSRGYLDAWSLGCSSIWSQGHWSRGLVVAGHLVASVWSRAFGRSAFGCRAFGRVVIWLHGHLVAWSLGCMVICSRVIWSQVI
jgi:hypothetical protein